MGTKPTIAGHGRPRRRTAEPSRGRSDADVELRRQHFDHRVGPAHLPRRPRGGRSRAGSSRARSRAVRAVQAVQAVQAVRASISRWREPRTAARCGAHRSSGRSSPVSGRRPGPGRPSHGGRRARRARCGRGGRTARRRGPVGGASGAAVGRPVAPGGVPAAVGERHGHHAVTDRHGPQPGPERPARGGDLDQATVGRSGTAASTGGSPSGRPARRRSVRAREACARPGVGEPVRRAVHGGPVFTARGCHGADARLPLTGPALTPHTHHATRSDGLTHLHHSFGVMFTDGLARAVRSSLGCISCPASPVGAALHRGNDARR